MADCIIHYNFLSFIIIILIVISHVIFCTLCRIVVESLLVVVSQPRSTLGIISMVLLASPSAVDEILVTWLRCVFLLWVVTNYLSYGYGNNLFFFARIWITVWGKSNSVSWNVFNRLVSPFDNDCLSDAIDKNNWKEVFSDWEKLVLCLLFVFPF